MNLKRFLAGAVVINVIIFYELTPIIAFTANPNGDNSITKAHSILTRPSNYTFNGTLKERNSGKVASNVDVELDGEINQTDSEGNFTFRRTLTGVHKLNISTSGYYVACSTNVEIKDNPTRQEYYLTKKEVMFKGSIKDEVKGNSLTKATVSLNGKSVETDVKGNFNFGKMPAGSYKMSVSKPGYVTYNTTISITKDTEKQYAIAKKKLHAFKATVKDLDDEKALANVTIKLGDLSAKTDSQGNAIFKDIPEKAYKLSIEKDGYKTYTVNVKLEDDLYSQYYITQVINFEAEQFRSKYPMETAFIEKIIPSISRIYLNTQIPWQVMIAQVCLESGYGKCEITDPVTGKGTKNLFGIKYRGDMQNKDKYVNVRTHEEISPKELDSWKKTHPELVVVGTKANKNLDVSVIAAFAKYNSYDEAFEAYKGVLLNDYFKHALRSASDPVKYIKDIQSQLPGESHPRYAMDGNYTDKIVALMKKWGFIK
jgi:flagellum-specific peptidoglycan hydrolase FlgJ/molybdopterin-binding protein